MDFSLIRHNTRRTGSRNLWEEDADRSFVTMRWRYDRVQGEEKGEMQRYWLSVRRKRGAPPLQKNWRVRWPSVFHRWSANVCVCAAMLSLVLHFPLFRVYFVLYADERNSRSNDGRWHLEFHPTLFSFFLLYPTRSVIDVAPATAIMFVNRKQ